MAYYRYSNYNYYRPSPFGGFKFFPPVIKSLLVSNVVIFMAAVLFGMFRIGELQLGEIITYVFALYPIGQGFQAWQLLTYMFMHGGFAHLFFNMLALWMFGMELENHWGSKKLLVYYLVCGLCAGVSNLFVGPLFGPTGPTVGASGAIYGILLAYGLIYPDRPVFVYFLLPIRARYFVLIYIALELWAGVTGSPDGIAHFAHLGGAAAGLLFLLGDSDRFPLRTWWRSWRTRMVYPPEFHDRYAQRKREEISDARYYDVHEADDEGIDQARVDEILDKISKEGYQSLTAEEKKILFEASKKLN